MKGAIVLVGAPTVVPFQEVAPAKRRDDAQAKAQYNPDPNAAAGRRPRRAAGGNPAAGGRRRGAAPARAGRSGAADRRAGHHDDQRLPADERRGGARQRRGPRARPDSRVQRHRLRPRRKKLPTVVLRNEDYGRIARILADGTPVTLEFNIVRTRRIPDGKTSYNADRRDSRAPTRPTKS